jgi:carboxypeptidase family protein
MRSASFLHRFIAVALFVLISAGSALSQSDRGAIVGTVLDSSGAVVQGATIVATGVDTGAVYKTTSTDTGAYRISDMQLGAYNLTVTATGFKTSEQKGVVVQVNTTSSLDITLQTGDVKETLTVLADVPTLQTESSDVGTIVDKRQIMELPLALGGQGVLRAPEAFVFLTPGTTGPGSNDSSNGVFEAKLGGGQNFGNEVILDGASTARADSGSAFDQTAPSVESLSEFKVTTSTVPAEFGRTSGGVESFATKSGTNAYHGTAYDIFRNEDLNANSWFNNLQNLPRNLDRKNDYGGTLGGPVRIPKLYNGRDKTFFFFSWEQYRQTQGSSNTSTVPTDAERQGDFSSLLGPPLMNGNQPVLNPCDNNNPIRQGQIFDPSTTRTVNGVQCRSPFRGNQITTISTVAQNILKLIPEPTDKTAFQRNFILTSNNPVLSTTMSFRIDQNVGEKHKFFFSYSSRDNENINGSPSLPNPLDTTFFSSFFTHYARFGWDYFYSSTLINHLNVGLNRVYSNSIATSVNGTDWDKAIGLTGANGPTFPPIGFNNDTQGLSSFGSPNADADVVNSLVVSDSLAWTRGRHNLRFGVDWRSFQFSVVDQSHQSPSIGFDIAQTAAEPGQGLLTGDPFASFLVGAPASVSLAVRAHQPRFVSNYYAAYVVDDFKARRNLTLNLGLRYDIETPRHEATGAQSVFDPNAPNIGTGGDPGAIGFDGVPLPGALVFGGTGTGRSGTSASGAKTYHKDFAPRIGFSYAPEALFGKLRQTVIRGGYGIYYSPLTYGDFGQALTDGFTASPSFGQPFAPALLLDSGIPSFAPPPNLDPGQDNGGSGGGFGGVTYLAPSYGRPGLVQNWDLEIQHQFTTDLILSVGYVGNHGTHLRSSLAQINNLNPRFFAIGEALGSPLLNNTIGVNSPFQNFENLYGSGVSIAQALRPFPQYQSINTDCCLENLGQSTYNALLAKLERRFHNGLNLLASYTYSKTLTDADSALPAFVAFSGGGSVQNSYNLKNEKALSYQDIPHTFVVSYIYELPVGKGKKFLNKGGAVDKALGGWQVGGVQRYQSGQPLAFGCATGIPAYDGCIRYDLVPGQPLLSPTAGSFNVGQAVTNLGLKNPITTGCMPNPNGNGTFVSPPGVTTYFNCAAFIDPNVTNLVNARGFTFGNMPRIIGSVRSQGYVNEDFSIIKRMRLFESHSLVLKAELFNAFNRHVFTRPDSGIQDGGFGASFNTVNGPRNVQFTLRYDF